MKGRHTTSRSKAAALALLVAVLLCSLAATAQLTLGDNLHMGMTGTAGYGYSSVFGNAGMQSSHSSGFAGSADLRGDYFNPNFLSFQLHPYYDQNQSNADSQTLTRGTGFGGMLNLFGGSHFPGSISYSKSFATNRQFMIAGVPTVAGDTSGQEFGIGWSETIPGLPPVSVSYSMGSADSTFLGSESNSSSRAFTLNSSYRLAGFNLDGNLSHTSGNFTTPDFLTGEKLASDSSNTSYALSLSHSLPLKGTFMFGWGHSHSDSNQGYGYGMTTYNVTTTFLPIQKLSVYQSANYTSNLQASLAQSVLNGALPSSLLSNSETSGVSYSAGAGYTVGHGVNVSGHFNHRVQWYSGSRYEDTQYGGNLTYNFSHRLLGFLHFGVGLVDIANKAGNQGMGINANVGMSRRFGLWETGADFNYAQAVQTLYALSTTSMYSYGASVKRPINKELRLGGAFRGSHSGIQNAENSDHAESFNGMLLWKKYNFGASYSQSSGTAVFTSTGELTTTPLGPLFSKQFLFLDSHSVSVNASTTLFRRVSVGGAYARFNTSSIQGDVVRLVNGNFYNFRMDYRLRKFMITGAFNRSLQEASTLPGGPRVVNSYYLSLSRWFNVF